MSNQLGLIIRQSGYRDATTSRFLAPDEGDFNFVLALQVPDSFGFHELPQFAIGNSALTLRKSAGSFGKKHEYGLFLLYFYSRGSMFLAFENPNYNLLSGGAVAAICTTQEVNLRRFRRHIPALGYWFRACPAAGFGREKSQTLKNLMP